METASSSETLVAIFHTIRALCQIPKTRNFDADVHENVRSLTVLLICECTEAHIIAYKHKIRNKQHTQVICFILYTQYIQHCNPKQQSSL
jgi:hypothetical protein